MMNDDPNYYINIRNMIPMGINTQNGYVQAGMS